MGYWSELRRRLMGTPAAEMRRLLIGDTEAMATAMALDSSDGPEADTVDGYRIRPGEEYDVLEEADER